MSTRQPRFVNKTTHFHVELLTQYSLGCYGGALASNSCPNLCPPGTYSTGGASTCPNIQAGKYCFMYNL